VKKPRTTSRRHLNCSAPLLCTLQARNFHLLPSKYRLSKTGALAFQDLSPDREVFIRHKSISTEKKVYPAISWFFLPSRQPLPTLKQRITIQFILLRGIYRYIRPTPYFNTSNTQSPPCRTIISILPRLRRDKLYPRVSVNRSTPRVSFPILEQSTGPVLNP
jgi:hypothetical protein